MRKNLKLNNMTIIEFLKALVSVDGQPSSKRFLAFVFSIVLIIAVFMQLQETTLYVLSGLITALLGITGVEKFSKNNRKSQDIG